MGQNHLELKDPGGKFFVKEMIEAAKKGGGWVTLSVDESREQEDRDKKAWIEKVEGEDFYINCGVFQ